MKKKKGLARGTSGRLCLRHLVLRKQVRCELCDDVQQYEEKTAN